MRQRASGCTTCLREASLRPQPAKGEYRAKGRITPIRSGRPDEVVLFDPTALVVLYADAAQVGVEAAGLKRPPRTPVTQHHEKPQQKQKWTHAEMGIPELAVSNSARLCPK